MPKKCRFSRDSSGLLTVDLDIEYPSRLVEFRYVQTVLGKHFNVAWGERVEDPRGDSCFWDFAWQGEVFTLHWDHWLGQDLTSCHPNGEGRLRQIAAYFGLVRIERTHDP